MGECGVPGVPPGLAPPRVGADLLILPPAPLEAEAAVGTKLDDRPSPSVRLHVAVRLQQGEKGWAGERLGASLPCWAAQLHWVLELADHVPSPAPGWGVSLLPLWLRAGAGVHGCGCI